MGIQFLFVLMMINEGTMVWVWAFRWFALYVVYRVGFGQSCPTFHKLPLPVKYQLQMTLIGIKWACHPSKQCLLGPRTKNVVIQGQWFGPSDGFLPHEFWCGLWTMDNILPNFSQTTSQISTPKDSMIGIKLACHPSKQCLLGPRTKHEVMQ
jgi:hypothetical protein